MKKTNPSARKAPASKEKDVPILQKPQRTTPSAPQPGLWRDDVSAPIQKTQPALESKTPVAKDVNVRMVEDQSQLSMKAKVEPIHSSVSAEDLRKTVPARRHLMVPINVQALVVPSPPSDKKPNMKNDKSSPFDKTQSKSFSTSYGQRASLKSEIQNLDSEGNSLSPGEEQKSGWGLPNPFDYQSAHPSASGLDVGIHLFWTLPKALLQGDVKDQDNGVQNEYNSPEGLVPDRYIPADEGYEHPITFEDAVENRVEFTTEETPDGTLRETLTFGQLPDRWIVIRLGSNPALKAWIIESSTLEVTPLAGYSPKPVYSNIPEMTAIGPNDGDIYWTATYDNAKNRFTFHDLPNNGETGPFDYIVCGWFSDPQNDPAFMPENASEEDWFAFIRDNLNWNVRRTDVDDDFSLSVPLMKFAMEVDS